MGRHSSKAPTELGQRLLELRSAARISARDLSEAAGASHSVVSHIETGVIEEPKAALVARLAKLLGTSSDFLISGIGKAPTVNATRSAWTRRVKAA